MTDANSRQVGGGHYKTEYEHWDLAVNTDMGYLEGCATKYISRWRKKGLLEDGLTDLAKARHYVDKLCEVVSDNRVVMRNFQLQCDEVEKFATANALTDDEKFLVFKLTVWRDRSDLIGVPELLDEMIAKHTPKPVPLEDSNKHAERE